MQTNLGELLALADHLRDARETILMAWSRQVRRDPNLSDGDSLPRAELYDHIPGLLRAFEHTLRQAAVPNAIEGTDAVAPAAAHGLERWQQGYDLREVTRELGALNQCVVLELDACAQLQSRLSPAAMAQARAMWARLCGTAIEESVTQYFELQKKEAAGQLEDLEQSLKEVRELEQYRADQWHQAAHDLRGNLGVVANVAVGLTRHGRRDDSRQEFVGILMRNVTSLHHLLEDVTSLARLQAGREQRRIEPIDATAVLQPLCEGIEPLAAQRGLTLEHDGPPRLDVDGDAVKIRRIAQNLILNAVKYTRRGGVRVSWGDSHGDDHKRWLLTIEDTGQGFHTDSAGPIAAGLESTRESPPPSASRSSPATKSNVLEHPTVGEAKGLAAVRTEAGEGIGLSIVKRLCEMLDAKIEMASIAGKGTTFRILFPRHYAN